MNPDTYENADLSSSESKSLADGLVTDKMDDLNEEMDSDMSADSMFNMQDFKNGNVKDESSGQLTQDLKVHLKNDELSWILNYLWHS